MTRPRVPDSVAHRSYEPGPRTILCRECSTSWRIACEECANSFADYHRGAFEGHQVTVILRGRNDDRPWNLGVPGSTSRLLGRY